MTSTAVVLLTTLAASAQGVADVPELADLRPRWTAALKTLDVPGFSVTVVKDGKVLAVDALGVRNSAGEPATPDTYYYIASATKPMTAMGVCLLAAEGKLELDAPVKKYLPKLHLPDEKLTESMMVRDLLCHRHGINSGPVVQRDAYTGQIDDEIYFALLREAEVAHQVRYSNVHFTLAGRVIESVSGKKWQDFLDQRLFGPAGMTRTTAFASEMYKATDHAEPMLLIGGAWVPCPLVKTDRTMHAAGGVGMSARDAGRWLLLNLNGGKIDQTVILPKALAGEYYTKQSEFPTRGAIRIEEGFAMGWQVGKYREQTRPYYFHGGGYSGASSYFCFLPNERIGVAVMANSDGGGGMATIVSIDILDRLLGMKDAKDLLPVYEKQAAERRARPTATPPAGDNPAKAEGGLSLAIAAYPGKYRHDKQGEAEVLLNARGELAARIGDLPITMVSRGTDKFQGYVTPDMLASGSFEVADGKVRVLEMVMDGQPTRFERVK